VAGDDAGTGKGAGVGEEVGRRARASVRWSGGGGGGDDEELASGGDGELASDAGAGAYLEK
jgi:hypothetical protein